MFSDSTGYPLYQFQNAACSGPSTLLDNLPLMTCDAQVGFQEFYYYVDGNVGLRPKTTNQCVGKVPPGQPPSPKVGPTNPPSPPKNPPSKTGPKNSPSKTVPKSLRAA